MTNFKLVIAYNGFGFSGFQIQSKQRTVEGELKAALSDLFGDLEFFVSAGRTDTGVHASGHVVNVGVETALSSERVYAALLSRLPSDIQLVSVEEVALDFDARRSAVSREYHYLFTPNKVSLPFDPYVTQVGFSPDEFDLDLFEAFIVGSKDFVNFRNLGSEENHTVRQVYEFSIETCELPPLYLEDSVLIYRIKICANSFLYRMVRNLVGAIFEVMRGKQTMDDFALLFNKPYKSFSYSAAPAKGLTLVKVNY